MSYFDTLLTTRKNPFEIDVELEIRKILEKNTSYQFEFQKNEDKFSYDISVFYYFINGADWEKIKIGFIEVEVSERWQTEYPNYWKDYSFLKRKVYEWNFFDRYYTGELKSNTEHSIYVIFNKSLTDCICQDMKTVSTFTEKKRFLTGNTRQDSFLCTTLDDKRIIKGVDNCLVFIKLFFENKAKNIK